MQGKFYSAPVPPQLSDSRRRMNEASGQKKRVYQVWKGSNRFFLGGRLIFGPDVWSMVLTIFLIIVPVLLFAVFVSERLANEFQHHFGELIVGIPVGFAFYDIVLLFLTSSRDPGIIPRNTRPPEPEDDNISNLSWTGSHGGLSSVPPFKDIIINGVLVRIKYCQTCMLYRPPRCSHCSICNNCVERFDHHCPWVGQCIGKRNYRFFVMFVASTTILCLYVLTFCCVSLKKFMVAYECDLWEALKKSPISGILVIYTFVVFWFVGGLTVFHMYLICTNQTTYENFRYRYDGKMNPYNQGCAQNFKEVFFSSIPTSKNDFRAKIKEDINVLSASLPKRQAIIPDNTKNNFDIELGGKRPALGAEEFEDVQSQISTLTALERSDTQTLHASWGSHKGNWEIASDIDGLTGEFGMELGFTETENV
ncbi:probable protein S-acyltransferase 7 [Phalaenopsis equestris]|uniref:probable protein S-acyltransferase 7 n=1 Tax=Phalaenopsis equestris TaxID=78828 RepID=UPI0009E4B35C|nr:probable protein S-acyltransferase 7 [Phalaenopsis equestris]